MFQKKLSKQSRSTLAIAGSMSGLWLLGVMTLALYPADDHIIDRSADYRQQASGMTYAYQDVTGQFTVYVRGSQRVSSP